MSKYFIHSWKDIGSKFLAELIDDQEIIIYGEYDIAGKQWVPAGDAGEPIKPRPLEKVTHSEEQERFWIAELNKTISKKEFNRIWKIIQKYKDEE